MSSPGAKRLSLKSKLVPLKLDATAITLRLSLTTLLNGFMLVCAIGNPAKTYSTFEDVFGKDPHRGSSPVAFTLSATLANGNSLLWAIQDKRMALSAMLETGAFPRQQVTELFAAVTDPLDSEVTASELETFLTDVLDELSQFPKLANSEHPAIVHHINDWLADQTQVLFAED